MRIENFKLPKLKQSAKIDLLAIHKRFKQNFADFANVAQGNHFII